MARWISTIFVASMVGNNPASTPSFYPALDGAGNAYATFTDVGVGVAKIDFSASAQHEITSIIPVVSILTSNNYIVQTANVTLARVDLTVFDTGGVARDPTQYYLVCHNIND